MQEDLNLKPEQQRHLRHEQRWRDNIKTRKSEELPQHSYGGARERTYSSYSFTTSALDGVELSASRPGRVLTPGKGPPVPIVQEARWAPEPA
jgi:hypothetical protein